MTNEKSVSCILSSVARNLLKVDVTWGKIASLYCVAGGLAVDCVRQVTQWNVMTLIWQGIHFCFFAALYCSYF